MAIDQKVWQGIRYAAIAGGMYAAGHYGAKIGITADQIPGLVDQGLDLTKRAIELGGAILSFAAIIQGFLVAKGNTMVPTAVVEASKVDPAVPTIPVASGLTGKPVPPA